MSQNGSPFTWTPPGSDRGAGGRTFSNSGGSGGGGLFDMSAPAGLGSPGSSFGSPMQPMPMQGSPQRSVAISPYAPPYQNVSNFSTPGRGPREPRPYYGPQNQTNPNQSRFANESMFNRTGPGINQTIPDYPSYPSPVIRNALSFNDEPGSIHPDWQNEWQEQWNELNNRRQAEESILRELGLLPVGDGGGNATFNAPGPPGRGVGPVVPPPNGSLAPGRAPPMNPEESINLMEFSLPTQGDETFSYPRELHTSIDRNNYQRAPNDYDQLKQNLSLGNRPRDDAFMNLVKETVEQRQRDLKRMEMNRGLNTSAPTYLPSEVNPLPGNRYYPPVLNYSDWGNPNPNGTIMNMDSVQLQLWDLSERPYANGGSHSFSRPPPPRPPGEVPRRTSVGDTPIGSDLIDLERAIFHAALDELKNKNQVIIPDLNAGVRPKTPKRTSASPRRKSKEGETAPDDVMMDLHKLIVGRVTTLKNDLMGQGMQAMIQANIGDTLNSLLPEMVLGLAGSQLAEFVTPQIQEKVKPLIVDACTELYGPGLAPVIPLLKSGTYVCSKPCVCGENPKCAAKTGGSCQGSVPAGLNCLPPAAQNCCSDQSHACQPQGGSDGGGCNDACVKVKQPEPCPRHPSCAPQTASRACGTSRNYDDVPLDDGYGGRGGGRYPDDFDARRPSRGRSRFPADCLSSCACKRSQSRSRGR